MRVLGALSIVALSSAALAAPNDFRLNARGADGQGLLFSESGARFIANETQWKALVGELAFVFAPRIASPAETLGHAGFHLGVLWSGTLVSKDEAYWKITEQGQRGSPNGLLQTLQVDIRKGLPLSFELGVNALWLVESQMWAPGIELRWALHEGYHFAPDVGLRGSVNHLVGNRDLNLTVIGLDAVLSKGFGIAGVMNLAPYLSYSILMIAASSRVLDPTPTEEADVGRNLVLPELAAGSNVAQKLTLGSRFLFSLLNVSVQGELEFLRDTPTGVKIFGPVATISAKLGLDY